PTALATRFFSTDSRWLVMGTVPHVGSSLAYLWRKEQVESQTPPLILGRFDSTRLVPVDSRGRATNSESDLSLSSAAFSPDGRALVTGNRPGCVELWNLDLNESLHVVRQVAGRNLTAMEWAQYLPGKTYQPTFRELTAERQG